ncbi:hypothetical protein JAAARDRAFT_220735 [Jaapia argillacea MUCL 33604]|uniref:Uncharacterized protein n=1 Tax=Jaapia argillacea MUCL 33604 TaxID=933084 RepID=A0A067QDK7_9AGAM|nr:hypothetical protein JAAARDRAFT_220735 [Jaapia argillacea MUCL 33604]
MNCPLVLEGTCWMGAAPYQMVRKFNIQTWTSQWRHPEFRRQFGERASRLVNQYEGVEVGLFHLSLPVVWQIAALFAPGVLSAGLDIFMMILTCISRNLLLRAASEAGCAFTT